MRIQTINSMVLRPCLGLVLLLPACRNDGGGDSGGDGGTDGAGTGGDGDDGADDESGGGDPPGPNENGGHCGSDVYGWQTICMVQAATSWAGDKGQIPGAPVDGDGTDRRLCCEGSPSVATADTGCESICQLEICEAARLDHMNRCHSCGPWDCGFNMSDCLAGGAHTQVVTCVSPLQVPYSYTLTASCSAFNNETRNPDGSFGFLEDPNIPHNDPPICNPPSNLEHDPPRGLGQYKGSQSDGTVARVTWAMGEAGGEEHSDELDVLFQYAIIPCTAPSNQCLQLAALELTLPTTEVLGMTLTHARLTVISVAEAPMMERGDHFRFSEGSIRVLMQAYVDGFPLVLSGWNAGTPRGRLSPAGDQFSFTNLRFELEDSVITAALELDLHGQYDARRPNAQITHVTAPTSCDEPITLLATSWDDDQDPLTHTWWFRDIGTFSGPTVEVVLPAGEHDVMLTSFDPSGLFGSETLRYARTCQ